MTQMVETFFKEEVVRDPAYLKWIRAQPCEGCKQLGFSVAHHQPKKGEGAEAQKTDDTRTLPLCRPHYWNGILVEGCHGKLHRIGRDSFWQGRDPERIIERLNALYTAKVKELKRG